MTSTATAIPTAATVAATATTAAPTTPHDADAGTRRRVLQLVASEGPVSAPELAAALSLSAVAVRRHLGTLEQGGQIEVHRTPAAGPAGRRGRPARRWIVTEDGQTVLSQRYAELASSALRFLVETGGPDAVEAFAEHRARQLEARLAPAVADVSLPVGDRVAALADELTGHGYAASARPVPGGAAVQLCQGHCPVQDVAREFPQLCEAEARGFSRLLGVHVQRLSTLAGGGHVCTTSIPTRIPIPARRTEGPLA
ncbi:helix-turn-helix transcriptional regulator [Cellulomonas marina]|uniref:Predicted transcriptional regulator, ArsR family n=1 Tax=Cellulomonas marina TaxID=988821 RepID=A0A1I0ZU79_9CELL|nr:helix-turn-helix domain-containing protein [Cellulomonas marina]GIG28787.1 hypothetical protein Cma02nite_13870 [Cellulomonas marina]SFB28646.1 Predicted transcriptional regulator, ArsR family [Cellulomonas marina]